MSIVKDSTKIKQALLKRLQDVYPSDKGQGYVGAKVIQDASERKFKITAGCLSRYFAGKTNKSILSEEQIIWLCVRYGLPVQLIVLLMFLIATISFLLPCVCILPNFGMFKSIALALDSFILIWNI